MAGEGGADGAKGMEWAADPWLVSITWAARVVKTAIAKGPKALDTVSPVGWYWPGEPEDDGKDEGGAGERELTPSLPRGLPLTSKIVLR